jgi:predicted cobalt transporter CbtA
MAVKFDADLARERFAEANVEELVRVAYVDSESFVVEAVELAKAELLNRGIDGQAHPDARKAARDVKAQALEVQETAEKPANGFVLVFSFFLADIFAIAAALLYSGNGRVRAAAEVWKAFAFGWLARFAAIAWITYPWGE